MTLQGSQLSFLIEVPPYELANPPRVGDRIATTAGSATVTRIDQAGQESIFWADYGSGIPQPHASEAIQSTEPAPSPQRVRRHTPKGKASGWIETRNGNVKRKRPSVSHFYKWEDVEGRGSRYIPAGKVERVRVVYGERRSVVEVLGFLGG
jgi:hypothetical protein